MKANNTKRFDTRSIMLTAHDIRKAEGVTMGIALKKAWSVAKIQIGVSSLDGVADRLSDIYAKIEELKKLAAPLEDTMKAACGESPDGRISGYGWKASYREIKGHRFDSKALKAADADTFNRFYVETSTMRFNFGLVAAAI